MAVRTSAVRPQMPASGSAVTVTSTESMARPGAYFPSLLVAACVTVEEPASTPVTVIVFAVSQSDGVNVTAALTVALAGVPLVGVTVTLAVGFELSTTV